MKLKRLFKASVLLLIAGSIFGCQQATRDSAPSGAIQVRIPWFTGEKYELVLKTITTVENVSSMQGSTARFLLGADEKNNQLIGLDPSVRYIRGGGGEYVPTDITSLQMFSLYAYLEELRAFEAELGIVRPPGPITVVFRARLSDGNGGAEKNNARYWTKYDAINYTPYEGDQLQLESNPGVIAHEYFHSIFDRIVVSQLPEGFVDSEAPRGRRNVHQKPIKPKATRQLYHAILIQGISEGLADTWGWIYSQDPRFINASVEGLRRRSLVAEEAVTDDKLNHFMFEYQMANQISRDGMAYKFGSKLARKLYQSAIQAKGLSAQAQRYEIARAVVHSLEDLNKAIAQLKENEYLSPTEILRVIQKQTLQVQVVGGGAK